MVNISPERKLKFLSLYMDQYIDAWPNKIKPFPRWLESTLDKRANAGEKKKQEYFKRVCRYCKRNFDVSPTVPTKDHIIPLSKGGFNVKENRVACCAECNTWKDNKTLPDWLKEVMGWLNSNKTHPIFDKKELTLMVQNIRSVYKYIKENAKKVSLYKIS